MPSRHLLFDQYSIPVKRFQISVYRSVRYACVGRGYDPADHVGCLSCQISVTGFRLPCHCEERSDAAISCRNVRSQKDSGIGIFSMEYRFRSIQIATLYQEIATGLAALAMTYFLRFSSAFTCLLTLRCRRSHDSALRIGCL